MDGWATCGTCGLKHRVRLDGSCPRCSGVAGVGPAEPPTDAERSTRLAGVLLIIQGATPLLGIAALVLLAPRLFAVVLANGGAGPLGLVPVAVYVLAAPVVGYLLCRGKSWARWLAAAYWATGVLVALGHTISSVWGPAAGTAPVSRSAGSGSVLVDVLPPVCGLLLLLGRGWSWTGRWVLFGLAVMPWHLLTVVAQ